MIDTIIVKGVPVRIEGFKEQINHRIQNTFWVDLTDDHIRNPVEINESVTVLPAYWATMVSTLWKIPALHLKVVSQNVIKIRKQLRGGGGSGTEGQINISPFSLDEGYNNLVNQTLLHEIGHKINQSYQCVEHMSAHDRELMNRVPHRGKTSGSGEGYADCYMDYYTGGTMQFDRPFHLGGLNFTCHGRPVIYSAQELNRKRLEAFLSVPPMLNGTN
ncbi:MAG: hypothetical protein WCJ26_10250 [bacterium]